MEEFTIIKTMEWDKSTGVMEIVDGFANMVGMVKVEKEIKIDNDKSLKKWKPVLDALKIPDIERTVKIVYSDIDPYGEEDWNNDVIEIDPFRLFMAVYAEFHQNHNWGNPEIHHQYVWQIPDPTNFRLGGDYVQNLLPMSMKILSKLNIRDKKYEIKVGLPVSVVKIKIKQEVFNGLKYGYGMDVVQKLETNIVDMLTDKINKELENKNNIYIESLANSLSFTMDNDSNFNFILSSKYEIK